MAVSKQNSFFKYTMHKVYFKCTLNIVYHYISKCHKSESTSKSTLPLLIPTHTCPGMSTAPMSC